MDAKELSKKAKGGEPFVAVGGTLASVRSFNEPTHIIHFARGKAIAQVELYTTFRLEADDLERLIAHLNNEHLHSSLPRAAAELGWEPGTWLMRDVDLLSLSPFYRYVTIE